MTRQNKTFRRLMTIPAVGVIIATAMSAATRDPVDFKSGRHFSAWLGLVPRQNATGGVDRLGGDQQARKWLSTSPADPW